MLRYLLLALFVVGCNQSEVVRDRSVQPAPEALMTCSSNASGSALECSGGQTLPLPPTFPHSSQCNECLTTLVGNVASVKCPNGLTFSFHVIEGKPGKEGTSCSVTQDGWVKCTDGTSYKLEKGPKGDKGDKGDKGNDGIAGKDGGSCRVTRDAQDRVIIRCDDGSQEVLSCGGYGCWSFGAQGNVYDIPSTTTQLPNLDTMTPVESVEIPQFDIFNRQASLGFPGLPHRIQYYAIRFKGYIELPKCKNDKCFFRVTSDDGARFYLNSSLVVNNDGLHPPQQKTGSVLAQQGWHAFRIDWFQGPVTQIALALELSVDGGVSYQVVPESQLKFQVSQ